MCHPHRASRGEDAVPPGLAWSWESGDAEDLCLLFGGLFPLPFHSLRPGLPSFPPTPGPLELSPGVTGRVGMLSSQGTLRPLCAPCPPPLSGVCSQGAWGKVCPPSPPRWVCLCDYPWCSLRTAQRLSLSLLLSAWLFRNSLGLAFIYKGWRSSGQAEEGVDLRGRRRDLGNVSLPIQSP